MKPIVTLTTDWGLKDHFTGALKGALLKALPEVTIVDITHLIPAHNILVAAYTFKNAWKNFPDGTIHFIGVDSFSIEKSELIAIDYEGHIFVGFDCGIFSIVFESQPEKIYKLNTNFGKVNLSKFFVLLASELSSGKLLAELGTPVNTYLERNLFAPRIEEMSIVGHVIHIDEYGNLVSNIDKEIFEYVKSDRDFTIQILSRQFTIKNISKWYDDVALGELLALMNEAGFLEIAVNGGRATQLFNMKFGSNIRIEFNDNKNRKADHKAFSLS